MTETHKHWLGWWAGTQQQILEQALAAGGPFAPLFGWARPALQFHIRQQRALLAGWQEALDVAERYTEAGASSAPDTARAATRETQPKAAPARAAKAIAKPSRAASRDDLKQIAGIGPVLEKKLNAEGIRTFAQLAGLARADVERLEANVVRFPGRITRENWIGQAKQLAKG